MTQQRNRRSQRSTGDAYGEPVTDERGLPLVLHVRDAYAEAAAVLREKPLRVEAEVHCFTGSISEAEMLREAGVTRFGIGGKLTLDGMDDLRDCVRALPLAALLLETDAPFVKPRGYEGKVNTSETLPVAAELIADLKGLPPETVAAALNRNAEAFFGLGGKPMLSSEDAETGPGGDAHEPESAE